MTPRRALAIALGLAVAVLALHHPIAPLGAAPAARVQWDTIGFSYPYLAFISRCFRSGFIPQWNPFNFAGTPFLGNLQTAMFNLPSALFALCSELTVSRFQVLILVQIWLGALGMYLWGQARSGSRLAGLAGALTFAGCGMVVNYLSHYILLALLCVLPYPFAALEMWQRRRRWPRLLLGTVSVATWLLTSYPSACGYQCLAFAIYFFMRRRPWREMALEALAFAVLPALIAAIHLLPAFALLPQVTRGTGLSLAAGWDNSFHPVQLMSLVLPALASAPSDLTVPDVTLRSLGVGAVPCLLALVSLTRPTRGRVLLLVAALMCIDLMLGPRSLLMPLVHRVSYLSAHSRHPIVDFGSLLIFIVITLTMDGVADLLTGVSPRRWLTALAVLLLAWGSFHLFGTGHYAAALANPRWLTYTVWVPALSLALLSLAWLIGRSRVTTLAIAVLVCCFTDAAWSLRANRPTMYRAVPPTYFTRQAADYRSATASYFDIAHKWPRAQVHPTNDNHHLVDGLLSDWGYDSTILKVHEQAMADPRTHQQLLAAAPAEGEARVEITRYLPNIIDYTVSAASPTQVIFHELDVPGWQLTVDGVARPIETSGLLRAAPVQAGDHRLQFRYRAPGSGAGCVLTLLGLLGSAVLCHTVARRKRQPSTSATSV